MDSQFWNDEFMGNPEFVDVAEQVLVSELDALEPGRALDLGCGSGRNALMLAKRGWSTVGGAWAAHAIGLAEQDAAAQALDATFIVGDTKTWRADATLELVISTYALLPRCSPMDRPPTRVLNTLKEPPNPAANRST